MQRGASENTIVELQLHPNGTFQFLKIKNCSYLDILVKYLNFFKFFQKIGFEEKI